MPDSFDALVNRMLDGDEQSRREFLRRLGMTGFALTGASTLLAACGGVEGTNENGTSEQPKTANHPKTEIGNWTFANWPLYIDKQILKDFDKKFGGKVKYVEEINDNEEFFGKVREPLQRGRSIGRDMVVLTDWMAARWIRLGYVEPIDKKNVPNAEKNLIETLRGPEFDKDRSFTLPWQSGQTGIGYDPKRTGREIKSVSDLFDPKFKGRVGLFSDARDTANLVMLSQGVAEPEKANIDQVLTAIEKVDEENRKGQIRRFTGNDYTTDLAKGNLWLCMAYSGDVAALKEDNPNLEFVVPEEGGNIWTDNMMMPKKVEHPYAAETFMNYVYDVKVAAQLVINTYYVSPVVNVKDEVAKTEPELADNPLIFPPQEVLDRLHPFPVLSEEDERRMNEAMQAVVGA